MVLRKLIRRGRRAKEGQWSVEWTTEEFDAPADGRGNQLSNTILVVVSSSE